MAGVIRTVNPRSTGSLRRFVAQQLVPLCAATPCELRGKPNSHEAVLNPPPPSSSTPPPSPPPNRSSFNTAQPVCPFSRSSLQGGVTGRKVRNLYSNPPLLSVVMLLAASRL